ncbi:MAG TPA: lamin tail domain-containing protein [Acidimicrobiia bacterium]|nr:lamin tail domain-containing protein [Acidimicrobiia bacterium]
MLLFIGLVGLVIGLINLVRPTGRLGISSRTGAGWLVTGSVVVLLIAGTVTSPESGPDQEAVATTAVSPDEGTTTSSPTSTTSSVAADPGPSTPSEPSGDSDSPLPPSAQSAAVAAITDGDTIEVSLADGSRETVRLIGINSPESGECWASEATQALEDLISVGTEIGLTVDESNRDQFGRLLRYVWVGSTSVNEEMVRQGAALSRRYPPDTAMAERFEAAQSYARVDEAGLWAAAACGPAADADLRIVELRYDADGNDNENLNDEWIRISNAGSAVVDLTGWGIKDESASNRFVFPDGFALAPGQSVTVHTGCGDGSDTTLYWCSVGSAVWNNDGDTAFLIDPAGNTHFMWAYSP